MERSYSNTTGQFSVSDPEPKAEPVTIIALCDGSVCKIVGNVEHHHMADVERLNEVAAGMLVERIAKRVVELQAQPAIIKVDGQVSAASYEAMKATFTEAARVRDQFVRNVGAALAEYTAHFG